MSLETPGPPCALWTRIPCRRGEAESPWMLSTGIEAFASHSDASTGRWYLLLALLVSQDSLCFQHGTTDLCPHMLSTENKNCTKLYRNKICTKVATRATKGPLGPGFAAVYLDCYGDYDKGEQRL